MLLTNEPEKAFWQFHQARLSNRLIKNAADRQKNAAVTDEHSSWADDASKAANVPYIAILAKPALMPVSC
jgi:hypothetical protein